tara:strand:+ start:10318 stop:10659 length:342 start_codon:yes stop_codon:yes gene_type:complete
LTEQFTEALHLPVKEGADRLRGMIPLGKASPPSKKDDLYRSVRDPLGDACAKKVNVVDNQLTVHQFVSSCRKKLDQGLAGGVRSWRSGIAYGQYCDTQGDEIDVIRAGHIDVS